MSTKILVTGADGFIGSHVIEELVRAGYDVRAFVYYNSFNSWGWLDSLPREVIDAVEVVAGDIRDSSGVDAAVNGCQKVLHLAALIAMKVRLAAIFSRVSSRWESILDSRISSMICLCSSFCVRE